MSQETKRFEFGDYILDAREKVLLLNGRSIPVPPKIFDLLLVLVENHGHVVEKEVLMARLWTDTFVEESNLTLASANCVKFSVTKHRIRLLSRLYRNAVTGLLPMSPSGKTKAFH